MKVLMIGVDESTKGGMWTVVENYLNDKEFTEQNHLQYIPMSITGCPIINKLLFTFKAYIKVMKAYRKDRFDILHVHMSERGSIKRKGLAMRYAKKKGSKIVLHMHGAEFEVLYRQMNEKKQKDVRDVLKLADRVIILGEYWSDFISGIMDDPKKVSVVYNAVSVPEENLYDRDSNGILFLGAVSKRKGIDTLIQALKEKETALGTICQVMIYGPDVEGNIAEIIDRNGLTSWVSYCGWLGKNEKAGVLSKVALNVLPSFNEGLPMTILEAMSYGVPTISTSVAAIPEAVNAANGVLIQPGDVQALGEAIEQLMRNRELRYSLSEKAYQDAVNRFSVKQHIRQIQQIYTEVTNKG